MSTSGHLSAIITKMTEHPIDDWNLTAINSAQEVGGRAAFVDANLAVMLCCALWRIISRHVDEPKGSSVAEAAAAAETAMVKLLDSYYLPKVSSNGLQRKFLSHPWLLLLG